MYGTILSTLTKKRPNSFSLEWNEEWGFYEDPEFNPQYKEDNRMWVLSYYDKTPVGFTEIKDHDFDAVMERFVRHLVEEGHLSSEDFEDEADAMAFKLEYE